MLAKGGYAAIFALALGTAIHVAGLAAWQVWLFLALPDVVLLYGMGRGMERGRLRPSAVPWYNALHQPWPPLALALSAFLLLGGGPWLAAGLAWLAHVAMDRAVGYGLRSADGWQRRPA